MRKAQVYVHSQLAAELIEHNDQSFELLYDHNYTGPPISLTLPIQKKKYRFESFPAFFEGVLPEGPQLEALLKQKKIDERDYFSQLMTVGEDLVGAVTVIEVSK